MSEFDADDVVIVVPAVDDYEDDPELLKLRICALCKAGLLLKAMAEWFKFYTTLLPLTDYHYFGLADLSC